MRVAEARTLRGAAAGARPELQGEGTRGKL